MDFFLQNFIGYGVFGSAFSWAQELISILQMLTALFILYVYCLGFAKIYKWFSLGRTQNREEFELQKAKWDAVENKRLLRMGAHVGFEGVGAEFEHDNRRGKR
mgnify:CR=1 FL=1|jgi:hypothetical protein